MRREICWASFLAVTLTLIVTAPAAGQFAQYTSPGELGRVPQNQSEALEKAVEEARWKLGPLRLDPAFWISDISWYDDPVTGEGDLTARAGAGLRGYVPIGSKTTLALYALPEYVWWQEREDERRLNQRFGIGSFTHFNRLDIQVTATRDEDFGIQSGDLLQRTTLRTDELRAELEVPVARWLSLYAGGSQSDIESLAEDEILDAVYSDLDRTETVYRGGFRFYLGEELFLGAGVGQTEADFAETAENRSNTGDFEYFEIGYLRPKLEIEASIETLTAEASEGSSFGSFEGETGRGRITWMPREKLWASLYGARQLSFSLLFSLGESFYVDQRIGLEAGFGLGWRTELSFFYEDGSHEYQGDFGRTDDVTSYGGDVTIELVRSLALVAGLRHTGIDSPDPLPDQELDELRLSLSFGFGQGTWY